MMKLILCLALVCLFSSTAEAQLECVDEQHGTSSVMTCEYVDDLCATLGLISEERTQQHIIRTCLPSTLCTEEDQMFSLSEGVNVMASSISCCNTDHCNHGTAPSIDIQTKNGLTCATCAHHQDVCENIISTKCVGIQDRCIEGNATDGDMNYQFLGCVSANLCEFLTRQDIQTALSNSIVFTSAPKCCKTNFCNSAGTVGLSAAPLLLGLVVIFVF